MSFWSPTLHLCLRGEEARRSWDRLGDILQAEQQDTDFLELRAVEHALLDDRCRIGLGYRLTRVALSELARRLSRGLGHFLVDLVQPNSHQLEPDRWVSDVRLAVVVLNEVIKRRFDRLESCLAVVSRRKKICYGFVGVSYQWFSHAELWSHLQEEIRRQALSYELQEVRLFNKHLLIYLKETEPLLTLPVKGQREPFYGGILASNSDIGRSAVRLRSALFRPTTGSRCVGPASAVRHVNGKAFGRQLTQLLETRVGGWSPAEGEELASHLDRLRATSLSVDEINEEGVKTAVHQRAIRLASAIRLPFWLARSLVEWALRRGSYGDSVETYPSIYEAYVHRNQFDVYNAMGALALRQPIAWQERLEDCAHTFLTGAWNLVPAEQEKESVS